MARLEIFDVTVPIRDGMLHYPGDPAVRLELVRSLAAGDTANLTKLDFGLHTGTHVDAPFHHLEDGAGTETLPLAAMIGPADVVDATKLEEGPIGATDLGALDIPVDCERLLLKSRNSQLWELEEFSAEFLSLDGSGARFVTERGIVLVGIDYLSVGDDEAHRVLLRNGVIPVEGLDLRGIQPGRYQLVCLPLPVAGADGAPARVVLIRGSA